jgi:hypothetical protein
VGAVVVGDAVGEWVSQVVDFAITPQPIRAPVASWMTIARPTTLSVVWPVEMLTFEPVEEPSAWAVYTNGFHGSLDSAVES